MSVVEHAFRWVFTLSFGAALTVIFGTAILITAIVCIVGSFVQCAWRKYISQRGV